MADAVFTQRLVTGVAPLALLFLIIVGAIVAGVGAAALITWVDRYIHADTEQAVANIPDELTPPPAAPDNTQGFNLGDLDECALILAATNDREAELAAGCDRLRAAIRDEQQKGEQA